MYKYLLATLCTALSHSASTMACEEQKIDLSLVPPQIVASAQDALQGVEFSEAERISPSDVSFYELEGSKDGKHYSIYLTESGEVVRVDEETPADQ